jgi:REP element-mobilizing transposase RayT
MRQSFASLHCHLVFSTNHRENLIDAELQMRLFEYLGGMARGLKSVLLAAGGMPDHVHLLVSTSREMSVSDLLRELKAESSKWIHRTFPARSQFAWQAGYGAFAVSFSQLDAVKQYIGNQPEHHRVKSLQEEFLSLLKKYHLEFDERYLWD